ncbi:MAG TPA: hypothetical protein PKC24_06545 [Cyclobacteriaceae bacterium]|nr:hypothetical protein [Cyclobacteriaceae bacterium]
MKRSILFGLMAGLMSLQLNAQQEIPFKSSDDFEIEIDYTFKQRNSVSSNSVNLAETTKDFERRLGSSPLPYLILNVHVKTLQPNEKSVRVTDNTRRNISNKKLKGSITLKLDMGFTSDVKDGISPYMFYITFMDDNKDNVSLILISVEQDGTFLVNKEVRGRF